MNTPATGASQAPSAKSASSPASSPACPLCGPDDDRAVHVVVRHRDWRVLRVLDNPDHPAFWRVVWNTHAAEMTDLAPEQRVALMQVVYTVEQVLRAELQPTKINLASLGNVVPHLHWHLIARFDNDRHFPQPVWAAPQREPDTRHLVRLSARLHAVDRALQQALMQR